MEPTNTPAIVEDRIDSVQSFINPFTIDDSFLEKRPLSYSSLKHFRECPRNYIQYLKEPKDPEAFVLENAVDCLAITPEEYPVRFQVYDKFDKRTNEAKEKWKTMIAQATANKQTLIDRETELKARIIVDSLYSHDQARELLEAKRHAQSILRWTDKDTGLPVIAKIDFEAECWDTEFIVDLKTAANANPDNFNRDIFKWGYNVQAGCYTTAYAKKLFRFPSFINIVVEKTEPYNVTLMHYDNKEIAKAKEEFQGLLQAFRICKEADLWHMSYDFFLFGTRRTNPVSTPGYYRPRPSGFNNE